MNATTYEISVIVPVYNRFYELDLTLDALSKQTLSKDKYEVIICDDGSDQPIPQLIKKYEDKMNLRYCYQTHNGFGVAAARNMGIRVSQGNICAFIDDTVLLLPTALEAHVTAHVHEKCAVLGYLYGFDDLNANYDTVKHIVDTNKNLEDSVDKLKEVNILDSREVVYRELGDTIDNYPAPWVLFWSCNMSVRRQFLFDVGLFTQDFNTWGGEDNDLALALFSNGAEFILDRNIKGIHYPHPKVHNIINNPALAQQDFEKKLNYFYEKFKVETIKDWLNIHELKLNQWLIKNQNKN